MRACHHRPVTTAPLETTIESYRRSLLDLADLVGDQGHAPSSARRWERLVSQAQAERLTLRESPEGRSAITSLMQDPRPTVRLWSAGAALSWDEAAALETLRELRESPSQYGIHSISAKHLMLAFESGDLDPDAQPRWG
jgi:hypothetical protein